MEREAGVYVIRCVTTGEVYIGGSIDVSARLKYHRVALRGGRHHNRRLQSAWDRLGEEKFTFEVLELVPEGTFLGDAEAAWMERLAAEGPGRSVNGSSGYCGHRVVPVGGWSARRRLV